MAAGRWELNLSTWISFVCTILPTGRAWDRVEVSHWSRSTQILCSHWWTPFYAGSKICAITTDWMASKDILCCYGMISGPFMERIFYRKCSNVIKTMEKRENAWYKLHFTSLDLCLYGIREQHLILWPLQWLHSDLVVFLNPVNCLYDLLMSPEVFLSDDSYGLSTGFPNCLQQSSPPQCRGFSEVVANYFMPQRTSSAIQIPMLGDPSWFFVA